MAKNNNLHQAKKAKNDEFYTQLTDIEKECKHYKKHFKGATILCNCNDALHSNFAVYFSLNFEVLGLKKLICTSYGEDAKALIYEGDKNGNGVPDLDEWQTIKLEGDGGFDSPECIEFLKEADIVVTNPPFSCYSFDTEVLTNHGWKFIKDVDITKDLIYSLNPDNDAIEIVKAVDYLKSPVNGKLYHFHSHNMDFMVTGNHKMFTYGTNCNYKGLINAENIKKSHRLKITGFQWEGEHKEEFILPSVTQREQYSRKEIVVDEKHIPMGDWCEFFGLWLADGCTRCGNNSQGNPRYTVSVKQNKRNEDYIINLFRSIGFECKKEKGNGDNHNYTVYSKQLWEYLHQFGKSRDKYIPQEILSLDKENLTRLFNGYINGDSTKGNGDIVLSSVSKKLMDCVQEVILKVFGNISNVRTVNATYNGEPYTYYAISLQRNLTHRSFAKYGIPELVDYNNFVYCLTLEKNHIMLTRHNGVIGWCGNCFRDFVSTMTRYDKKFLIIGNGNAVTYKEVFPLIKENKMWIGASKGIGGKLHFIVDESYENKHCFHNLDGIKIAQVNTACWFTNLDHDKRHYPLDLYKKYYKDSDEYPKYDNYDAIEVSKTCDIPMDYEGVMGVPISFLDKYCPEQFEIVGIANSARWIGDFPCYTIINGQKIYNRILIRHINPTK